MIRPEILRLLGIFEKSCSNLVEEKEKIEQGFREIVEKMFKACEAAIGGDLDRARKLASEACDIEVSLIGDCEASGALSDYLDPTGESDEKHVLDRLTHPDIIE